MKISFFAVASCVLFAPTLHAQTAQTRMVGFVYPADASEESNVWLGGAYFPRKGWRTDAQAKGALLPGTRWQLFGLNGAGPSLTSEQGEINDVPLGYIAQLRQNVMGEKPMIAISNASPKAQPRLPQMQNLNQRNLSTRRGGLAARAV